jgi:hypothetical protein
LAKYTHRGILGPSLVTEFFSNLLGLYQAVGGKEPENEVVMFEFDLSRITESGFNSRETE